MRLSTLRALAESHRVRLPAALTDHDPLRVPADQRGWYRFQRTYDAARATVRSEEAMRRLMREAVEDDAAEGSVRLELQVDPTSYAPFVGGITPALEILMDEAAIAARDVGISVGLIVACSRTRHPLEARTLARLAKLHAGNGAGQIIGFGLSNDERRGETSAWADAFRIARHAGLPGVPHGGELLGPQHIRDVLTHLKPRRLGHGVRAGEDPALLELLGEEGVALEVCPTSNIALGVYEDLSEHPLPSLARAGMTIALGADDPLLFHSRLIDQYQAARDLGMSDAELAELARGSIRASFASHAEKNSWLAAVNHWLTTPINSPDGAMRP